MKMDGRQCRAIIAADAANQIPEWVPTNQLSRRTRQARKDMGEARWAEVNRQWNDPAFIADRLDKEQQA